MTHHLFLWPQNALGKPVRIRRAPRTPKAGSNLVSSMMADGVGLVVLVGVGVMVTLTADEITVVIGTFWSPERLSVVTVTGRVVSTVKGVGEARDLVGVIDWANVEVKA